MKDFIPFAIVAVVCFALGALSFKQRSTPTIITTNTVDTVKVYEWATITDWKIRTIRDTVRIPIKITDSVLCCSQLDDCAEQLWTLGNLEVEAEQDLANGGKATVGFSVPIYLQTPESAFRLLVTQPQTDTTRIEYRTLEREWYHRIGISAGVGYGAGPLGMGPSVNIQAGYELFSLSDIWK